MIKCNFQGKRVDSEMRIAHRRHILSCFVPKELWISTGCIITALLNTVSLGAVSTGLDTDKG